MSQNGISQFRERFRLLALAWAVALAAGPVLAKDPSQPRDLEPACARKFIADHLIDPEPYVGAPAPLRGKPVQAEIDFRGERIRAFRELGDGTYGVAYLGRFRGRTVVVKRLKDAAPDLAMRREIRLTEFLSRKGYDLAPILEVSEPDRILIKEYAQGFYLEDLERHLRYGRITPARLTEARRSLADLQYRLRRLMNGNEFGSWAASNGMPRLIDVDESNFLYREGRWILIDP